MKGFSTRVSTASSFQTPNHTRTFKSAICTCSCTTRWSSNGFFIAVGRRKTLKRWKQLFNDCGTINFEVRIEPVSVSNRKQTEVWILMVILMVRSNLYFHSLNYAISSFSVKGDFDHVEYFNQWRVYPRTARVRTLRQLQTFILQQYFSRTVAGCKVYFLNLLQFSASSF